MKNSQFKVRDLSQRGFYVKSDTYLNGWAKYCGWKATIVYDSLCRHSDRNQESFPSRKLISEEHGVSESTIKRGLEVLKNFNIIRFSQKRSVKGKFLHNTYYLLDKSEWIRPVGLPRPSVHRGSPQTFTVGLPRPNKDTHNKDTHVELSPNFYKSKKISSNLDLSLKSKKISLKQTPKISLKQTHEEEPGEEEPGETHIPYKKMEYLLNIPNQDLELLSKNLEITPDQIRSKGEDLHNYCEAKGRIYKNYRALLRNSLKKDFPLKTTFRIIPI